MVSPVTEGALRLLLRPASGEPLTTAIPAPSRPGIYQAELTAPAAGTYQMELLPEGKGFADRIVVPGVYVRPTPKGGPSKNGKKMSILRHWELLSSSVTAAALFHSLKSSSGALMFCCAGPSRSSCQDSCRQAVNWLLLPMARPRWRRHFQGCSRLSNQCPTWVNGWQKAS